MSVGQFILLHRINKEKIIYSVIVGKNWFIDNSIIHGEEEL